MLEPPRQLVEARFRAAAPAGNAAPSIGSILEELELSRQVFYRCLEFLDDLMATVQNDGCRRLAGVRLGIRSGS